MRLVLFSLAIALLPYPKYMVEFVNVSSPE